MAEVNNATCNFTETSNGIYTLNICNNTSNNVTVNYTIYGGSSYMDVTDSLTFIHSNISENITLTPATTANFVRPNLSENGTLGGNSFAVSGSMRNTDSWYGPWRAVDNDMYSYWRPEMWDSDAEFIFYNPVGLNVSQLIMSVEDEWYAPSTINIYGSNDYQNWDNLGTFNNEERETQFYINLVQSNFYKYYKLLIYSYDMLELQNLDITATYKVPESSS